VRWQNLWCRAVLRFENKGWGCFMCSDKHIRGGCAESGQPLAASSCRLSRCVGGIVVFKAALRIQKKGVGLGLQTGRGRGECCQPAGAGYPSGTVDTIVLACSEKKKRH
jgi:hypothetical protein